MDHLDREIIKVLQGDIPLEAQPYRAMAEHLELTEEEFLGRVNALQQQGVIRRLCAIIRHRQAGISGNAMVVWRVEATELDRVGKMFAQNPQVTHCYSRLTFPDWPYNLYTMLYSDNPASCEELARQMSLSSGVEDYQILHSTRELKKTSMNFIPND